MLQLSLLSIISFESLISYLCVRSTVRIKQTALIDMYLKVFQINDFWTHENYYFKTKLMSAWIITMTIFYLKAILLNYNYRYCFEYFISIFIYFASHSTIQNIPKYKNLWLKCSYTKACRSSKAWPKNVN